MPPTIHHVAMTRPSLTRGRPGPVRMVVMHAAGGAYPGDYNWLKNGGSVERPVSVHYYIDKRGTITQFVADGDTAWHAGKSTWVVDGKKLDYTIGCNPVSIGIELENRNTGTDPYPAEQYNAALWLVRQLVAEYGIPSHQLVRHRDIAPDRKTDPNGFPWQQFVRNVYTSETQAINVLLSEDATIISPPRAIFEQCVRYILARKHGYSNGDVGVIVAHYFDRCQPVGVDPLVAIAQMLHETGNLTSFWSQRPQRNPAGIGVNGEWSRVPTKGYVYNTQRSRWERGLSFPDWQKDSIPAHIGRLVAYAVPSVQWNAAQQAIVAQALEYRGLPTKCWGSAPTLKLLGAAPNPVDGCGWAGNGEEGQMYGARIAAIMNAIRGY